MQWLAASGPTQEARSRRSAIRTKKGETAEQAAGRVRKQAFLVRISAGEGFSREKLREKATKVAEQVAGNLF
jgi:hypothetical protein